MEVVGGQAPPALILGLHSGRAELSHEWEHGDHEHEDEPHAHRFAQFTFTTEQPLDRAAVADAIDALPPGIVRAKGIFYLADTPGEQVILQLASRRWEWQAGAAWGDRRPYSRLVLIGPRPLVDDESLRVGLTACLVRAPARR